MRRGSPSTRGGSPLPPAGTLAIGLGIVAGGIALSVSVVVAPTGWHVPAWVAHVVAGTIGLLGLQLALVGAGRLVRRRRRDHFERFHPDRAWEGDHRWTPPLVRADSTDRIVPHLLGLAALTGFTVIGGFIATAGLMAIPFAIGALITLLITLFVAGRTAKLLRRRLRFGVPMLRLPAMPIRPGETVEAQLELRAAFARHATGTSVLRFVEERIVQRPSSDGTITEVRAFTQWEDEEVFGDPGGDGPSPPGGASGPARIPLRFTVPDEPVWTTALADHPPRYWQLEVHLPCRGPDLVCTFPLPVYADG